MKKVVIFILFFVASLALVGCDKISIDDPVLSGDKEITLEVGTNYSELGLKNFTEGVTVEGTVDIDTIGDYEISYSITDEDGLIKTIKRTVHVVDTTLPVITIIGGDASIEIGMTYSDEGARATDNYDGDLTSLITSTNDINNQVVGSYLITYKVIDASGNEGTVTRTVTVTEKGNAAPVITLLGDANVTLFVGDTYTDEGATASDREDGNLTANIVTTNNVDTNIAGVYTITYNVTDNDNENATTVSRTVTVVVDEFPVITLIGEEVVNLLVGEFYAELGAAALDKEDGDISEDIYITTDLDTNVVGTYTVSYNVEDSSSNEAITITRTVNVLSNDAPVITVIGDQIISLDINQVYDDLGCTASDTEDGDLTSSVITDSSVDTSVAGEYIVSYTVTDSNSNSVTVNRTVVVLEEYNNNPVLRVPGPTSYTITTGNDFDYPDATAWDFEDGDISESVTITDDINTDIAGEYIVTYSVTDSKSVEVSIEIMVTVISDNIAPVITVDGQTEYIVVLNSDAINPTFTAWDQEDGSLTDDVIVNNPVDMSALGRYVITYTVTDSDFATTVETIIVNIVNEENTSPVLTLVGGNVSIKQDSVYEDLGVSAWDDQDGDLSEYVHIDTWDLDVTTPGVYTIVYTITDQNYNTSTTTREVTVVAFDNTDPVITLNGAAYTTISEGLMYTDAGATASDAEDGDISSSIIISGIVDTDNPGLYLVTYTVTDNDGMTISITREVEVLLNEAAVITLIGADIVFVNVFDTYQDLGAIATDSVDGSLTDHIITESTVNTEMPGEYIVTYKVTDTSGKTAYNFRRVVVVNNVSNIYKTVLIEKGLELDYDDLFTKLGLTKPTEFSLDTTTVHKEFMMFNEYGVLFIVASENILVETVTIDTLLYISNETLNTNSSNILKIAIYRGCYLELNKETIGLGDFTIGTGYHQSLVSVGGYNSSNTKSYISEGYYDISVSSQLSTGYSVYSITCIEDYIQTQITVPLNEFVYVYEMKSTKEFVFNANGGELQLNLYGPNHYLITIYDSEDNIIISRNESGLFTLTQNFSAGAYKIVVEKYDNENQLIVYIGTTINMNYGYINANTIDITSEVRVDVIPGYSWYKFNVTDAGWYTLTDLEYHSQYISKTLYNNDLLEQSGSTFYFEEGTNYINIYGAGVYLFKLDKDTGLATSNNQMELSASLSLNEDLSIFFDNEITTKWFTFTLTEETVVEFELEYQTFNLNPTMHLYDSEGIQINSGKTNEKITDKLQPGIYYISFKSASQSRLNVSSSSFDLLEPSLDDTLPTAITTDSIVSGLSLYKTECYYSLTVAETGYYYLPYSGRSATLYIGDQNVYLSNYNTATLYLEAGTHEMIYQADYADKIFELGFILLNQPHSGFSSNYSDAPFRTEYSNDYYFATQEKELAYERILVTETEMQRLNIENCYYVRIFNQDGQVIQEGDSYDIFPVVFEPGVYTIEYTVDYKGYMTVYESTKEPLDEYSRTIDQVTIIDTFTDIHGYLGQDTMDTIKVTIPKDMLLMIDHDYQLELFVLDSNKELLLKRGPNYESTQFIDLEAGDYYFIINYDKDFYDIYLSDATDMIASNTSSNATEVYVENGMSRHFINPLEPAYFTFTVEKNTELEITIHNITGYEIYDSIGNVYTLPYFKEDTYIIKAIYNNVNYDYKDIPREIHIEIQNISGYILSNNKDTAVLLQSDVNVYGRLPIPDQETWYKFTVEENELINVYKSNNDAFTVFDEGYNEITLQSENNHLPVGTYYIRLRDTKTTHNQYYESYSVTITKVLYYDAPSVCADAQTIDLVSGTYTIQGNLLSETDVDCYKINVNNKAKFYFNASNNSLTYLQVNQNGELIEDIGSSENFIVRGEEFIYIKVSGSNIAHYYIHLTNDTAALIEGTLEDATQIELNEQIVAYRETSSEDDYFELTIKESTKIGIDYYMGSHFFFYNESMELLPNFDNELAAGTYFIKFNTGKVGTYIFMFYSINEEPEDNEQNQEVYPPVSSFEDPIIITDRYFNIYSMNRDDYNREDFYKIELDEKTLYNLSDNSEGSTLYVYDDQFNQISRYSDFNYDDELYYLDAGTYYFKVTRTDRYDITFSAYSYRDISNDSESPTEIFMYERVHSFVLGLTDADYLTFTLDQEKIIEFVQRHGIIIEVFNQAGETVIDTYNSIDAAKLPAGTYTVTLTTLYSEAEEYSWYMNERNEGYTATSLDDAETFTLGTEEFTTIDIYSENKTPIYIMMNITEFTVLMHSGDFSIFTTEGTLVEDYRLQPGTYRILAYTTTVSKQFYIRNITKDYYGTGANQLSFDIGQSVFMYMIDKNDIVTTSFTASKDTVVYFDGYLRDFDYTILDEDSNILYQGSIDYYTKDSVYFSFIEGHTYTLELLSSSSYIHFKFNELLFRDFSNDSLNPKTLVNYEVINTEIYSSEDLDYYTFTLTEDTVLTLAGIDYTLTDSDSVETEYLAGQSNSIILSAGTYTVKVHYSTLREYTIKITPHVD